MRRYSVEGSGRVCKTRANGSVGSIPTRRTIWASSQEVKDIGTEKNESSD